jgi:hypothetical protein
MWLILSFFVQILSLLIRQVHGQAIEFYGPNGSCEPPLVTSIIIAPALYSQFFQSAETVFNIFGSTNNITINNAPTLFITTTYVTTTYVPTSTTVYVQNSTASPTQDASSANPTAGTASGTLTSFPTPPPHTTFTPVPPSPTLTAPAPPLSIVTVGDNGVTTTITVAPPDPTIGEGLPSGTAPPESIPSSDPVLLVFNFDIPMPANGRLGPALRPRQTDNSNNGAAVGFAQADATDPTPGTGNNCGFATRYFLTGGRLQSGNDSVGRNYTDFFAAMKPNSYYNDVTTTFTFVDGVLR